MIVECFFFLVFWVCFWKEVFFGVLFLVKGRGRVGVRGRSVGLVVSFVCLYRMRLWAGVLFWVGVGGVVVIGRFLISRVNVLVTR